MILREHKTIRLFLLLWPSEALIDNRDLIAAQQNPAEAERSYLRSIYRYDLSRLALVRAIGFVERVLV